MEAEFSKIVKRAVNVGDGSRFVDLLQKHLLIKDAMTLIKCEERSVFIHVLNGGSVEGYSTDKSDRTTYRILNSAISKLRKLCS